jgi:hypothetical protein
MFADCAKAQVSGGVDGGRKEWLETLAAACERVLVRDASDELGAPSPALIEDVSKLLGWIRAELARSGA